MRFEPPFGGCGQRPSVTINVQADVPCGTHQVVIVLDAPSGTRRGGGAPLAGWGPFGEGSCRSRRWSWKNGFHRWTRGHLMADRRR